MSDLIKEQAEILVIEGVWQPAPSTHLFALYANNQQVFSISSNGTVKVDPQYTIGQAVDEFWKWISRDTNILQLAVDQAKREEREAIVKQIEDQGRQWGMMRSMRMTNYSEAAEDLANLIRK